MDIKQYFSLKLPSSFKDIFFKIKNTKKNALLLFPGSIACIIILALIPLFTFLYVGYKKQGRLIQAEERIASLEIKAKKTALIRSRASLFIKQLQSADKEFLNHHVEALSFLNKEKKALEIFFKTPIMKESFSLSERKKYLEENKIVLEEISKKEKENIQEKIYALKVPIEIDFSDLQSLLKNIESPSLEKPQLIFQKITLKRNQFYKVMKLHE